MDTIYYDLKEKKAILDNDLIENAEDTITMEEYLSLYDLVNYIGEDMNKIKKYNDFYKVYFEKTVSIKIRENHILGIRINYFNIKELQINRFPYLTEFDLSANNIEKIVGLDQLSRLERIDLSCNNLTELPNIEMLPNLKEVYINNNKIKKLNICSKSLKRVYIINNYVSDEDSKTKDIELII